MYCTRLFWQHYCLIKRQGHTRVASASASASFVFSLYCNVLFCTFALQAWGKKESWRQDSIYNILGQILIIGLVQDGVDCKWQAPPAIRAWGVTGVRATAALSYSPPQEGNEALGDSGVEGKALRVLVCLEYTNTYFLCLSLFPWGYISWRSKEYCIALLVGCPSSSVLPFCHSDRYNPYFYR